MKHTELQALADRVEGASPRDPELVHALLLGLGAAYPEDTGPDAPDPRALGSTEYALGIVRRKLPGWQVQLEGRAREPDGGWCCTLRESTARDDDTLIGVGRGPTAALAIVAALIKIGARRKAGYR